MPRGETNGAAGTGGGLGIVLDLAREGPTWPKASPHGTATPPVAIGVAQAESGAEAEGDLGGADAGLGLGLGHGGVGGGGGAA
jgi:hypothetical protein